MIFKNRQHFSNNSNLYNFSILFRPSVFEDLTKNFKERVSSKYNKLELKVLYRSSKVVKCFTEKVSLSGVDNLNPRFFRRIFRIIGNIFESPFVCKELKESGSHPDMMSSLDHLITLIEIIKIKELNVIFLNHSFRLMRNNYSKL